jgi:hypothetical protein
MLDGILNSILHGFTNWKTSLTSILGAVALILSNFHVLTITADQQTTLVAAIIIVVGWFAKDATNDINPE